MKLTLGSASTFQTQKQDESKGKLAEVTPIIATDPKAVAKALQDGATVLIIPTNSVEAGRTLGKKAGVKYGWAWRHAFKTDVGGTARKAVTYGEIYVPERQPENLDDL